MKKMKYKRKCPECNKNLTYSTKQFYKKCITENTLCRSCAKLGINNPMYGRTQTNEVKENLRRLALIRFKYGMPDETKKKISEKNKGNVGYWKNKKRPDITGQNHPFFGKSRPNLSGALHPMYGKEGYWKNKKRPEHSKAMSGVNSPSYGKVGYWKNKQMPKETKQKMSESQQGIKKPSMLGDKNPAKRPDIRTKIRLNALKRIKERVGQMMPNYNINSIPIIRDEAKRRNITDLQDAETPGGEFHIKELGYWVDGYSKEKNVVIEYYEKSHKKQKERDEQRQKEIENFLGCKFIIIYE